MRGWDINAWTLYSIPVAITVSSSPDWMARGRRWVDLQTSNARNLQGWMAILAKRKNFGKSMHPPAFSLCKSISACLWVWTNAQKARLSIYNLQCQKYHFSRLQRLVRLLEKAEKRESGFWWHKYIKEICSQTVNCRFQVTVTLLHHANVWLRRSYTKKSHQKKYSIYIYILCIKIWYSII